MKTINIIGCDLKEINISKTNGKITIGFCYSLIADDGKEYDTKRDMILDTELTTGQKNSINGILTAVENIIKSKDNI